MICRCLLNQFFILLLMLRLLSMINVHEALFRSLLDIENNNMYDVKWIILIFGYPCFITYEALVVMVKTQV